MKKGSIVDVSDYMRTKFTTISEVLWGSGVWKFGEKLYGDKEGRGRRDGERESVECDILSW